MTVFEKAGPHNTEACVAETLKAARELGLKHLVIASNYGDTVRLFLDRARKAGQDVHLVCVTHAFGCLKPGFCELGEEERKELMGQGVDVLSTTHVLSGAERGLSREFKGIGPVEVMAKTLYLFGQGVKVGVEVAVMALDAGLVPCGEDILAVGGTARGADTAIVVRPSHAASILETRIRAIVCKPWNF